MALMLAEQVCCCRIDDRLIFLDIRQDRYFGVCCPETADLETDFPPSIATALLAQGLLIDRQDVQDWHPSSLLPPARSSLLERAGTKPAATMAPKVLAACLVSLVELRFRKLSIVLDHARQRRGRIARSTEPSSELTSLVSGFVGARRWLPVAPRCLPDSLALMRILLSQGHQPSLVFGVIAYPFAAHCWLQQDDVVLNDRLDHVARFTPICRI